MTTQAHQPADSPKQHQSPADLLDHLGEEEIESFAALYGAPTGVAELAVSSMPRGTRIWAETYGLIEVTGEDVRLTDLGREMITEAAKRCPEPFADVSLSELVRSVQESARALSETGERAIESAVRH